MQLLEGMKRQPANQDLQPNTRTYSNLIAACRSGHQHALAVELYHEMQERGLQPNAYVFDTMLAVCKAGSLWQDGLDILKTMQVYPLSCSSYIIDPKRQPYEPCLTLCVPLPFHPAL